MTSKEAAIVCAYTGINLGKFSVFHKYAEEILGRPIFTHEFGNKAVAEEVHNKSKKDFIALKVEDEW